MKYRLTIQKFIAVFLAAVFLLSLLPKTWFHQLIANHKDLPGCPTKHHSAVLHQQPINCHFDDLVVNTPFIAVANPMVVGPLFIATNNEASPCIASPHQIIRLSVNRGPPVG